MVESTKRVNQFHVSLTTSIDLFDVKEAADTLLKLKKYNTSKCTMLKVCHTLSSQVAIKTIYNVREH